MVDEMGMISEKRLTDQKDALAVLFESSTAADDKDDGGDENASDDEEVHRQEEEVQVAPQDGYVPGERSEKLA